MIAGSYAYALRLLPMRGNGQDRAAVFERDDGGLVLVLADGAGGTSHGEVAAQAVVDTVQALARVDADWSSTLCSLDVDSERLRGGQTTAIVLIVGETIRGASVGDSEAWLVSPDGRIEPLTANQVRKPLVGAGCEPIATTGATLGTGTLVVASDGLFRHANARDIARIACKPMSRPRRRSSSSSCERHVERRSTTSVSLFAVRRAPDAWPNGWCLRDVRRRIDTVGSAASANVAFSRDRRAPSASAAEISSTSAYAHRLILAR